MTASSARGVLSGVVAGAGAWAAHALSGGEVTPVAGVVALSLSVALGPLLLTSRTSPRRPLRSVASGSARTDRTPAPSPAVDPLRVAALMLLAQGVWHAVFMISGATAHAHGTSAAHGAATETLATGILATASMLGAHLLVATVGTAAAVGLDRSLVRAAARVAATLVPRLLVRTWRPLTPATPAPVMTEDPTPLEAARFLTVRVLRGPPLLAVSALRG